MIENFKLKASRVVAGMLNYRRAADELHLTQPAATVRCKHLNLKMPAGVFAGGGRTPRFWWSVRARGLLKMPCTTIICRLTWRPRFYFRPLNS